MRAATCSTAFSAQSSPCRRFLGHDRFEEGVLTGIGIGIAEPDVCVAAARLGEADLPVAHIHDG